MEDKSRRSETSRTPAKVPDDPEYKYNWTRSDVSFEDIGGYYEVKEQLAEEVLQPARATARGDNRYDRFGIEPSRGMLFHGPPGTGKTLFARALAGELHFPFVELGPADVTSKWINEGPQRVRQLFEEADSIGPCVVFLDEAEHLFGGRDVGSGGAHAEDRKITSELLVHLTAEDRTAIVVGATNRPDDIDPAILRPGRLATHVEIGLPDTESRHAILQSKLGGYHTVSRESIWRSLQTRRPGVVAPNSKNSSPRPSAMLPDGMDSRSPSMTSRRLLRVRRWRATRMATHHPIPSGRSQRTR
jgi:SpoVK/Ycf46/Vps4 family AAA+-type ATPase